MASAIFVVDFPPETNLPPMDDPGDGSLHLAHSEGHGFSCIGQVPQAGTCLVRVWSDQTTIDAMAADARYLFVEQVD